jgi:hypothetical protein
MVKILHKLSGIINGKTGAFFHISAMALDAGIYTAPAAYTQSCIEFHHLTAAIAAYLNRANSYALVTIYAIFRLNSYYFN